MTEKDFSGETLCGTDRDLTTKPGTKFHACPQSLGSFRPLMALYCLYSRFAEVVAINEHAPSDPVSVALVPATFFD